MKVLTIKEPFATLIKNRVKYIETRIIATSRITEIKKRKNGISFLYEKKKNNVKIKTLSATGSKIVPKFDVWFNFLAKKPSRKSLNPLKMNKANDDK